MYFYHPKDFPYNYFHYLNFRDLVYSLLYGFLELLFPFLQFFFDNFPADTV